MWDKRVRGSILESRHAAAKFERYLLKRKGKKQYDGFEDEKDKLEEFKADEDKIEEDEIT